MSALLTAPVPRPPQPTMPILMRSALCCALAMDGKAKAPAAREEAARKSRRDTVGVGVFMRVLRAVTLKT